MAKYTGQCKNCGSDQHPNGNIFHIEDAAFFDAMRNAAGFEMPGTDKVKVCNNCGAPHAFRQRVSARQRKLQATADWLLAEYGA